MQPSGACSLPDAGGAFDGLLPDALLLDSSANEVAAMIMQELESDINSTEAEEQHAALASWTPLLPAASGNLPPSPAAGYASPVDQTCRAAPIWNNASLYAVQQQHEHAAAATAALPGTLLHFGQQMTAASLAGITAAGARASGAAAVLPCEAQFTALLQRRDSCAGGSSTLQCASPSSTPAFSAGGFLSASDDSSMPCGNAAAAAVPVRGGSAGMAAAAAANKRRAAAQVRLCSVILLLLVLC
jgi:hypothetical protein